MRAMMTVLVFVAAAEAQAEDADFALQGEYAGVLDGGGKRGKYGLQVIALGEGKLRAVLHAGGLPGRTREKPAREEAEGEGSGIEHAAWTAVIAGGAARFTSADGKKMGRLERLERKSPTLGAKPPKGAVVLFDGKSVDGWEPGARLGDGGLLMEGATSKHRFGNATVHVEFRTPYMPTARGQKRGNSGVYLQGRYEVQVLDSFGLEGKNNEAGGIYEVSDPLLNMAFPPLTWQTYDIHFVAPEFKDGQKVKSARVTVRHNGIVVQKETEVPGPTRAAPGKESPEPGPLFLQNHGDAVRFRNVWVVEKNIPRLGIRRN